MITKAKGAQIIATEEIAGKLQATIKKILQPNPVKGKVKGKTKEMAKTVESMPKTAKHAPKKH